MEQRIQKAYASAPKTWLWQAAGGVHAWPACWPGRRTAVQTSNRRRQRAGRWPGASFPAFFTPPDKTLLFDTGHQSGVPYLLLETFCIAFLGTIVGAVISHAPVLPLCQQSGAKAASALVGRMPSSRPSAPFRPFVYGLMFIRVTGPGAFAGLLTMSLCSIGMVSKMFIECIEDLDKRILESLGRGGLHHLPEDPLRHPAAADGGFHIYHHLPLRHELA